MADGHRLATALALAILLSIGIADRAAAAPDVRPGAKLKRVVEPLPPGKLRQDVLRYVESLRVQGPGTPYGVYRPAPSQAPSLYASCDAALVRYILGDLDWLDARQDPKTGLWGPDRGASTFDGMGATFHFLPLYEAADRTMPRGRQIVDATLAIQKSKHGTWGGVYADMDAVSLLAYFYVREDYRRDDIQQSLRTSIELLFKTAYDAKTGAFGDLANTVGACEHLAETAAVLKDHPYCGVGWRRAWDWRLWKCRW